MTAATPRSSCTRDLSSSARGSSRHPRARTLRSTASSWRCSTGSSRAAKNGNLLLNFPLPNSGQLDLEEMNVLEGITAWMAVNSEGIYASRPWKIYGEGPSTMVKIEAGNFNEDKQKDLTAEDVRFTTRGSTLYAFVRSEEHTSELQSLRHLV